LKKTHILIVEDDIESAMYLKEYLEECSFMVDVFNTATDAIFHIKFKQYALVLLDLNLPDFEGFEILKFLNNDNYSIPVIVLSGYSDIDIKLKAFKFGAKDYIVKPVDPNELEARIWVQLGNATKVKTLSDKKPFEIINNEIYYKKQLLKLTRIEFKLFSILIENPNKIVSRDELSSVLSSRSRGRTLDGHIKNIRKKLSMIEGIPKDIISTEYGIGYKLIV